MRVRSTWTASSAGSFWSTPFASFFFPLVLFAFLLALILLVCGAHLLHFFASLCPLFIAQLAVFIGVEFLEHLLAHFGALAIGFLAVLLGRLGNCRQGQ